jgi:flagellar hook protein FlgE
MSFQTGLSGLNASSRSLDVIGNNIANANTTGMKSSRTEFGDLIASSLGAGGSGGPGIGVTIQTISQQFTQGNINTTGNNLDVAINGGGFFQLTQLDGSAAYTRDGSFKLDKNGNIVTNTGANVMGYPTDKAGLPTSTTIQKLVLPTAAPIAASATTAVNAEFNLDARVKPATSITPPTPITTYGTSLVAFDSQGVEVPVSLNFVKTGPDLANGVLVDTWDVYDATTAATGTAALAANGPIAVTNAANFALDKKNTALNVINDALDVSNTATNTANGNNALPTYGDPTNSLTQYPTYLIPGQNPLGTVIPPATALAPSGALFQMTFDANGKLTAPSGTTSLTLTSPNPAVGTNGQFTAQLDVSKATQYGSAFAVSNLTQDGYTAGELTGLSVGVDGVITSRYSNGQTQSAGKVTLADFRNVQGLSPLGNNAWAATSASGQPVQGAPGSGKFGALKSGALEESNVDLTSELVNMMTAQRAYQANAQTIKTQDQVLSTLVNLR